MIYSDNTAANVLIRTLGEDTLNQRARDYMGRRGVNELTTSDVNPIHEVHFVANMWSPSTG